MLIGRMKRRDTGNDAVRRPLRNVWSMEPAKSPLQSSRPRGLIFDFDAKKGTLNSQVKGKAQETATFTRAGNVTYWDKTGVLRTAVDNQARFESGALLLEPGATNKCIRPRNFGAWTAQGTPTEAQTQVGIDGVANTAWLIGDDSAAANEGEQISVTVVDNSAVHAVKFFMGKSTGGAPYPDLTIFFSGGTAKTYAATIDLATGVLTARTGTFTKMFTVDRGTFWEVNLSCANTSAGNTVMNVRIYSAGAATAGGSLDVTLQRIVTLDWCNIELNTVYATSPIIGVDGSESSRTSEASGLTWTLPVGIFTGSQPFTAVVIVALGGAEADFAANHNILAISAAANSLVYVNNSGDFAIYDGTTEVSKDVNIVGGTLYKVAVKAQTNTGKLNVGAAAIGSPFLSTSWGTEQAYDGDMAVGASLLLGQTLGFPMKVYKAQIFNRILGDHEINALR